MPLDPVSLSVFDHRLSAIAEEMGVVLCRSAFSANIKERRDFSCALFDAGGNLIAQAAHIPVHLGSTQESVKAALAAHVLNDGDVVVLNDPFAGGTHLPDVTVVAPVFAGLRRIGYVADRAHHADIGGMSPGSMPMATEIYQEGLRLPPVKLVRGGRIDDGVIALFLANTRVPEERRGDLLAQLAALRTGAARLVELVEREGWRRVAAAMEALQDHAERSMRAVLRRLPAGVYRAVDHLDDDGAGSSRIPLRVRIEIRPGASRANGRSAAEFRRSRSGRKRGGPQVVVDFSGSASQVAGGVNANRAVTLAAVYYVFKLIGGEEVMPNAGFMRPIELIAPGGTVVNADFPAAVAGGNVETSQRIVDVLLRALARALPGRIPAASQGTMNNVAFGGYDPVRRRVFSYYETIGGGAGAGPSGDGCSAVHTHMTNTMNTPVEALEADLPVRVVSYRVRRGSGGAGRYRGGDGIEREIEFLVGAQGTVLSERRILRPWGLAGGESGRRGRNLLIRPRRRMEAVLRRGEPERAVCDGGSRKHQELPLAGKLLVYFGGGERLRVLTPGGGWVGDPQAPLIIRLRRVRTCMGGGSELGHEGADGNRADHSGGRWRGGLECYAATRLPPTLRSS